ncbi:MAG: hypothetical protein LBH38_02170 [Holosporales bacterium]|nr:hypothetical protein [Holosporales bacterium]
MKRKSKREVITKIEKSIEPYIGFTSSVPPRYFRFEELRHPAAASLQHYSEYSSS